MVTCFKFFLCGRFVSILADKIFIFYLPIAIYLTTNNVELSGLAYATQWGPRLIVLPLLGSLADKFSWKKSFFLVDTCRCILLLVIIFFQEIVALKMLALGILSILSGYTFLCVEKYVTLTGASSEVYRNQAETQSIDRIARALAPLCGAFLMKINGQSAIVIFCLICLCLSIIMTLSFSFIKNEVVLDYKRLNIFTDAYTALKIIFANATLLYFIILSCMLNFSDGVFMSLVSKIVISHYHREPLDIGIIFFAGIAISTICILIISRLPTWQSQMAKIGMTSFILMFCSICAMPIAPNILIFSVFYTIFITTQNIFVLYFRAARIKFIPAMHYGKTLGIMTTLLNFPMPLAGGFVFLAGERIPSFHLLIYAVAFSVIFGLFALGVIKIKSTL